MASRGDPAPDLADAPDRTDDAASSAAASSAAAPSAAASSAAAPSAGAGTACGKVLLLGEHAVVHGAPAIALGLPEGVRARAVRAGDVRPARLRVAAWSLDVRAGDAQPVARAFAAILDALGVAPVGLEVIVDAALPAGVGLGSSAALAVAVARAVGAVDGLDLDHPRLDAACLASERVFHGAPSGIDHTVAALGGVLRYRRATPPERHALVLGAPLELVVAVAAPGASTREMVERVGARLARNPRAGTAIIEAIAALVARGERALAAGDWLALGEAMEINHGLLMGLGVSTPALERAVEAARAAGALGAKLTGAGGGGCVVALAPGRQAQVAAALAALSPHKEVLCPTLRPPTL